MLYRPCLIKLIDPNNPAKWHYHLREQKLPFFITLAHEFLHALNQLECIDWLIKKNEGFSNPKNRLQEFLMEKLELKPDDNVLQEKYKIFWKNPNFDDSLDEMTVILKSKRQIALNERVFIGETTFLREYYKDKSIISWSHCPARDLEFWQKMIIILEKDYVKAVNEKFNLGNFSIRTYHALKLKKDKILKEYTDFFDAKRCLHETSFDVNDAIKNFQNKKFFVGSNKGGVVKVENFEVLKTDTFNVHLLPQYSKFILLNDYKCVSINIENDIDLLKIENSFYTKNNFNLALNDSILQHLKRISKNTLTNILIIVDYDIIKYQYWIITEDICQRSMTGNIEAILNKYSTAEKFYYNGFCFQKIINK